MNTDLPPPPPLMYECLPLLLRFLKLQFIAIQLIFPADFCSNAINALWHAAVFIIGIIRKIMISFFMKHLFNRNYSILSLSYGQLHCLLGSYVSGRSMSVTVGHDLIS